MSLPSSIVVNVGIPVSPVAPVAPVSAVVPVPPVGPSSSLLAQAATISANTAISAASQTLVRFTASPSSCSIRA